ncbi:MAG: PTS sugar transporter subunit IIA [Candidatus Krumholzibacteriota bacterium]|nr:PTS sugar transporter subunit IIA [Candidatus Krumholzibacteriota bacterium]
MRLSKDIKKSAISLDLAAADKDDALEELVDLLCAAYKLKARAEILEALKNRESKQSTGIGMGLAVPHAKTPAVDKLYVGFGLSRGGIDFDSIDGEKAKIFFILVSPLDVSGPHIKALAGISRLVKHEELRLALAECGNEKEFFDLVEKAEKKYL